MNAGDLFFAHVGSGRVAYVDLSRSEGPRTVAFEAFDAACNAFARGLRAAGRKPGDRMTILSHNRAEFIETIFDAMRAGCVPVPIGIRPSRQ